MRTHVHPKSTPRIEMVGSGDRTSNSLRPSHAEILLESRSAHNRRGIGAGSLVYVVSSAIGSHGASGLQTRGWVVRAVRFYNVVFDERALGPAINREIAIATWRECSGVPDYSAEGIVRPVKGDNFGLLAHMP